MKHSLDITDPSGVAECRRLARRLAEQCGLGDERTERLSIVATEAATNLLRHAGGGRVLLQRQPADGGDWLALAATDQGPGIPDLDEAQQDGFSTGSSAGTGLGAMRRLSDHFEMTSTPGKGTVLLCEFGGGRRGLGGVEVGALLANYPKQEACGDGWSARNRRGVVELLLIDGLGHGPRAEVAAAEAAEAFGRLEDPNPARLVAQLSTELAGTRGSVGCLARLEAADGRLALAGVGNVSALLVSGAGEVKRLISREGRLGGAVRLPPVEEAAIRPGDTLILHTDGLATLRTATDFPGMARRSCAMVAAMLMQSQIRGTDDAGVLVARPVPREETR
jgi:anti-sigma regulatory factor (Ser/Thr protein kinase)